MFRAEMQSTCLGVRCSNAEAGPCQEPSECEKVKAVRQTELEGLEIQLSAFQRSGSSPQSAVQLILTPASCKSHHYPDTEGTWY